MSKKYAVLAIPALLIVLFGLVRMSRQSSPSVQISATATAPATPTALSTTTVRQRPTAASPAVTITPDAGLPETIGLDPSDWKNWPVAPVVSQTAYEIYRKGQSLGRSSQAFSVLGDCHSVPETFLGLYDIDSEHVAALPADLQETILNFSGSFSKRGPTRMSGMVSSGLFSPLWHGGGYTCESDETPLDCEIRRNNPSIVLIAIGTHVSEREEIYMRRVLDGLIEQGIVPILTFKADNSEYDERVNALYARLAVEYDLPVWNFWLAVEDLPNRGLYVRQEMDAGKIYLTEEALAIHNRSALEALDTVWRAVRSEQ